MLEFPINFFWSLRISSWESLVEICQETAIKDMSEREMKSNDDHKFYWRWTFSDGGHQSLVVIKHENEFSKKREEYFLLNCPLTIAHICTCKDQRWTMPSIQWPTVRVAFVTFAIWIFRIESIGRTTRTVLTTTFSCKHSSDSNDSNEHKLKTGDSLVGNHH